MRQKGPLLAFDSFEEETFLVVPPCKCQEPTNIFCRTEIVISRLILCSRKAAPSPWNSFWAVDRRDLTDGAMKEGAVRTGIRYQEEKRTD